jgi:HrpA-like RNA helicase
MPTLLERDMIVPHFDMNPFQKMIGVQPSMVARDYFMKYIRLKTKNPATVPGDKVFILEAGTGAGKTSTLPTEFTYMGKTVGVAVPTRVVAQSTLVDVVKWNSKYKIGENIGIQTGLSKKVPKSGIVFMTTGIVLQHIITLTPEEFMRKYSVIFIDEVHKHSIDEDFFLMVYKKLLLEHYENPEFPILIMMSGTLDPRKYMEYFDSINYIHVRGKDSAPIREIFPGDDVDDLTKFIIEKLQLIYGKDGKNKRWDGDSKEYDTGLVRDTLIFMPTYGSISELAIEIRKAMPNKPVVEVTRATTSSKEYAELFTVEDSRIIIATNAAETGVTFPYLDCVIDSGLVNEVSFNPTHDCTVIQASSATIASFRQRRGRVGRHMPGTWYPAFTKKTYTQDAVPAAHPDIYISQFSDVMLEYLISQTNAEIKDNEVVHETKFNTDVSELLDFGLIHNPPIESVCHAFEKLYMLGFIDLEWMPTKFAVLARSMRMISLESKRMILEASMLNPDSVKYCVMLASCMSSMVKTDKEPWEIDKKINFPKEEKFNGFIKMIYHFQIIDATISNKLGIRTESIRKWCEKYEISMKSWNATFDIYRQIIGALISVGVPITGIGGTDGTRYIWEEAVDVIPSIKQAIYAGYRANLCKYDRTEEKYIGYHKSISFSATAHEGLTTKPQWIIIGGITYSASFKGKMRFSIPLYAMVMDVSDMELLDPHYIY